MHAVPGIAGYGKSVERFIEVSQTLCFDEVCRDFLPHLPAAPSRMLDVGCGVGQNAAALTQMGHSVVAVEPMPAFLTAAQNHYAKLEIEWIKDSLPELNRLNGLEATLDFILADGVWHHLDPQAQHNAIKRLASLLKPNGKCGLSLRNGPAGLGEYIMPTDVQRTLKHAEAAGLSCIFRIENQPSLLVSKAKVKWARLVLQKG
ncbi:class I SAM-dependent methyltransferase [Cerasicoccus arenae]|uniref:Methyltransferase domain-containing protein n=1 Tax=Cerasicoccus arenae TaxID=424488 RepID=A0A8J3GFE0_9BACT|nr:class I SAM-dependent methyltransferase [Cerasicoccus arenae]MBK1859384.1 class I SAM-dependent methyltransferase [Cerasicoccus arenae]GHC10667.1 hypothetical protein GCM10007047_29970 [Cerasicoccus arenae]